MSQRQVSDDVFRRRAVIIVLWMMVALAAVALVHIVWGNITVSEESLDIPTVPSSPIETAQQREGKVFLPEQNGQEKEGSEKGSNRRTLGQIGAQEGMGQSVAPQGLQIRQIYVGDYLRQAFQDTLTKNTPLYIYNDSTKPAFFYGLGTGQQLNVLREHKSFAVVIYTGGDADERRKEARDVFDYVRDKWFICGIAISHFIHNSLRAFKVRHIRRPFYPLKVEDVQPVTKGNAVYVYGNINAVYHSDIVMKYVQPLFPDLEFIYAAHHVKGSPPLPAPWRHFTKEELMTQVYPRCFLGIRLTSHDGLAGGVQELGILGIRSVWNGGTPSAIPWNTVGDIVKAVSEEKKTIGTKDPLIADAVKSFLKVKPDFYDLKTYFSDYL